MMIVPDVNEMTPQAMRNLIAEIQEILWFDARHQDPPAWNPDKEWDCANSMAEIATVLEDCGLKPRPAMKTKENDE
jgi:hypothetical protein